MSQGIVGLEEMLTVAPYLNKFILEDVGVLITDREKVLAYYPGQQLDFGISPGDVIDSEWVVHEVFDKKDRVVIEVDASVCGIPYIGVSNPIFNDDGEVIGGVTISQPTEKKEKLLEMSNNLLSATENVNNQAENISIEADEMVEVGDELGALSVKTEEKIANTDNIIKIIKDISKKIKMIGMNASIEAARVGEEGRGFAVVAEEVQNLANQSSQSTDDIELTLNQVNKTAEELQEVVEKINTATNKQTEVIKGVYAQIQNLNALGNDIVDMAERLSEDTY